METPRDKPQIFHNPYQAYCDTFNCTRQAKHFIGRPDGPLNICLNLCDECLTSILQHIPDEMKQHITPQDGYSLIKEESFDNMTTELMQLRNQIKELESEPESEPETTQQFTCTECGKSFATQQGLAAPSRTHK